MPKEKCEIYFSSIGSLSHLSSTVDVDASQMRDPCKTKLLHTLLFSGTLNKTKSCLINSQRDRVDKISTGMFNIGYETCTLESVSGSAMAAILYMSPLAVFTGWVNG